MEQQSWKKIIYLSAKSLWLALRSGQYKDLDVMVIKQGEYMGKDPETGKAKFQFIEDDDERETMPTIGYMAYFEYLNGFRNVPDIPEDADGFGDIDPDDLNADGLVDTTPPESTDEEE